MATGVTIRRVLVDTPGLEDVGEYILLHNNGPDDVVLTGWRVGDVLEHPHLPYVYEFPAGFVLLNGADLKLHSGAGTDDAQNLFWNHAKPVWTNLGDKALLVNDTEDLVDSITWTERPRAGRVVRTTEIAQEIAAHAAQIGGFGAPKGEPQWVPRNDDSEYFFQEFSNGGAIFHSGFPSPAAPEPVMLHVIPQIYTKFIGLGGTKDLGPPTTATVPAVPSQPGRKAFRNDFGDLSIYWSEPTGAHAVKGAIRAKWLGPELNGAEGPLGMPIDDERVDGSDAAEVHFSDFENGAIWSTPQSIRAFREIRVDYVGLHCFGETEIDGAFTSSDEIYFVAHVNPLDRPRERPQQADDSEWVTVLPPTGPAYTEVDSGEDHPDRVIVFQGRAAPLLISALTFEQDESDANALRGEIQTAVAAVGAVVSVIVPATTAIVMNPQVQAAVTNAVNRIADTGDDFIGRGAWNIGSRKSLLDILDGGLKTEPNVGIQHHGGIFMTDGDASYKAFFEIVVQPL